MLTVVNKITNDAQTQLSSDESISCSIDSDVSASLLPSATQKDEELDYLNGYLITNRIFTLPNLLTLIRLLLLIPFVYVFVTLQQNILAFVILCLSCITDFLDGFIARHNNAVSRLGMKFDPLVDRIVILVSVLCIYLVHRVPLWTLVILALRELSMGILYLYLKSKKREFRVIIPGKVATATLMVGFVSLVLNWPQVPGIALFDSPAFPGFGSAAAPLGIWFIYIGIFFSLLAACLYFIKYTKAS